MVNFKTGDIIIDKFQEGTHTRCQEGMWTNELAEVVAYGPSAITQLYASFGRDVLTERGAMGNMPQLRFHSIVVRWISCTHPYHQHTIKPRSNIMHWVGATASLDVMDGRYFRLYCPT